MVELFLPSGYTKNTYGWINNVVFRVRKRYRYHLRSANSVIHFKSKPRQICKRMRILIEHEHRVYLRSFEYLVNILQYDSTESNGILFITNQTLTQFNENTFAKLDYSENYCSCAFFWLFFHPSRVNVLLATVHMVIHIFATACTQKWPVTSGNCINKE